MSNNLNSSTFIFVRSLKENKVVQKKKKSSIGTKEQRNDFERAYTEKYWYRFQ